MSAVGVTPETPQIGLIGLGVMGENLALNIDDHGYSVALWTHTEGIVVAINARLLKPWPYERLCSPLLPPPAASQTKKEGHMKHLPHLLLSTVLVTFLPLTAGAQEEHDHSKMMAESEAPGTASDVAEGHACCQGMMKMHQKMQEQMKVKDADLARLVEAMKSSTGDAKVGAIAAALEELIDQHRSMHGMMMAHGSMPSMMMKEHQHMQSMGGEMDMSKCPMMEEMKMESGDESGEDEDNAAHDEHHSP